MGPSCEDNTIYAESTTYVCRIEYSRKWDKQENSPIWADCLSRGPVVSAIPDLTTSGQNAARWRSQGDWIGCGVSAAAWAVRDNRLVGLTAAEVMST